MFSVAARSSASSPRSARASATGRRDGARGNARARARGNARARARGTTTRGRGRTPLSSPRDVARARERRACATRAVEREDDGVDCLARALESNTTLERINLRYNLLAAPTRLALNKVAKERAVALQVEYH